MAEKTKESFSATLDSLLVSNAHARNKGDVFKDWCNDVFNMEARISHIKEQRQTTNRVSEQFRYFNPIVVFVCDDVVKRDVLKQYIISRSYRALKCVAIIGANVVKENDGTSRFEYTYEELLVFENNDFSEWARSFFSKVVDAKALKRESVSTADSSDYKGDVSPVIFYGVPGTGKTRFVQEEIFAKFSEDNRVFTTFHQSYSYEEFVEGLKPVLIDINAGANQTETDENLNDDEKKLDVGYTLEQGVFYKACERAAELAGYSDLDECVNDTNEEREDRFYAALEANNLVLLCIDEINRGNVASIFGDLISLIEPSKRLGAGDYEMIVTLPYSKKRFGVPANLFIVGTMNTADRSIQLLDTALRRRFRFVELQPNYEIIKNTTAKKILISLNARIRCLLDNNHQIGHSYFVNVAEEDNLGVLKVVRDNIIPLLEEYFYNDTKKIRLVLNEIKNDKNNFYIKDQLADKTLKELNQDDDEIDVEKEFYVLDPALDSIKESTLAKEYLDHIISSV